jgi:hypothetical protein
VEDTQSTVTSEEFDYGSLIPGGAKQAETPVEAKAEEAPAEPAEETPAETTAEEAKAETTTEEPKAETPAEPKAEEKPAEPERREGTPDKALQKVQQDLATALRKLDELSVRKAEQGGELTQQQEKQVQQQTERVSKLAEFLKDGYDFDPFKDLPVITKVVDELDTKAVQREARDAELQRRLDALEAKLAEQNAKTEEENFWASFQKENPGVDGRAIWDECLKAGATRGKSGDSLQAYADGLFTAKLEAAKAAAAAPKPAEKPASTPAKPAPQTAKRTTAPAAPPKTPGGTAVNVRSGGAAASAKPADEFSDEAMEAFYANLVKPGR